MALDIADWRRNLIPVAKRLLKTTGKQEEYWAETEAEALLWPYNIWPVSGVPEPAATEG